MGPSTGHVPNRTETTTMNESLEEHTKGTFLWEVGQFFGRSLLPIVALVLIAGTFLWGPWVTLLLTVVWWRIVTVVA